MTDYKVPVLENFEWQKPIKDRDLSAPPTGPSKGDRYIVKPNGSGAWAGHNSDIATYNGSGWDFTDPTDGMCAYIEDEDVFISCEAMSVGYNPWVWIHAPFKLWGGPADPSGTVNGNFGLGDGTFEYLDEGANNLVIGYNSGYNLLDGSDNLGLGHGSLYSVTDGGDNVGIGNSSLEDVETGDNNTALGTCSLANVLGSGCVGVGFYSGKYETGSNAFYVDNQDRTDTAGDKAGALLYGTFDPTPANQTLKVNATLTVLGPISGLRQSKSFVITNPTSSSDGPVWRAPVAITITAVHVLCMDGTNIVGQLWEYDTNGLNGSTVDASDITGTAGSNVNDDGTLSNPGIAAGNYLGWKTTSVSGTVTKVIVTFDYTVD